MPGSHKARLILLRHAKSDWAEAGLADFDRPLSKRGLKAAPAAGRWLKKHEYLPDLVISSPARRARETVVAVAGQLEIPEEQIIFDQRIYEASTARLLAVLAEHAADAACTLLTGHNPGMEELLLHLCDVEPPFSTDGKLMTTAALAVLRLKGPGDFAAHSARLEELRRPKD